MAKVCEVCGSPAGKSHRGSCPALKKKLPKGLEEFRASLDDTEHMDELATRLLDLPEHNFYRDIDAVRDAIKVAKAAEQALENARNLARRIAGRMWETAVSEWTVKELQEATGYDDE